MKLKKITALILCVLICFSAFACNKKEQEEETLITLTMHTNGGAELSPVKAKAGADISSLVPTPEKAFFTFDKWYSNADFTMPYTPTVMPDADIDIYARWTPVSVYTLSFVTNGGSAVAPVTAAMGESPERPQNPTRENYVFAGWYSDPQLQTAFSFSSKPDANRTLYADWMLAEGAIRVRFMGNGEILYECAVQKGQKLSKPELFGVDITYVDWYETDSQNAFDFSKAVNTDNVLLTLNTAYYTKGISYDGNEIKSYTGTSSTVILKPGSKLSPYAFYGNTTIKKIILPENLVDGIISGYAFYGCKNLREIYIPSTVTTIGDSAFFGCENLRTTADSGSFVLPGNVTAIGARAFLGCKSLSAVVFPRNLVSLGAYAFGDSGLTDADLTVCTNANFETLSEGVFSNCTALRSVTLSANLTEIGVKAFFNCSSATKFVISKKVEKIGAEAFARCTSITDLSVEDGSPYYKVIDKNLYDAGATTLLLCLATEPDFIAPASLKEIQRNAFYGNTYVKTITIEKTVDIVRGSFEGATGVTTLNLYDFGSNVIPVPVMFGAPDAQSNTVDNMYTPAGLTSINITGAVTEIPEYAFFGCIAVNSISVTNNDNLLSVGEYAYAYTAVTSFTVGSSLNLMGENVFAGCESLSTINDNALNNNFNTNNNCFYFKGTSVKRLIKAIGAEAEIIVDTDTTDIDNFAFFRYSANLKHLSIPFIGKSVANNDNLDLMYETYKVGSDNTVYAGDSYAFLPYIFGCPVADFNEAYTPHLEKLTLSKSTVTDKSIKIIPWAAFYYCDIEVFDFTAVKDTLTHYGSWAFTHNVNMKGFVAEAGNSSLVDFYNPYEEGSIDGIEVVGDYTFYECYLGGDKTASTPVTLNDKNNTVLTLNGSALILDESIEEIGEGAFCYNNFYNIIINADLDIIPLRAFFINPNIIGDYKKGEKTYVYIPKTVENIDAFAFTMYDYSYDYIDESINGNLEVIFEKDSTLKSLIENSAVIVNSAFGFAGVRKITLPNSLEYIGHKAFQYCPLTEMEFENINQSSLKTIYIHAFNNTQLMKTLYLPPSLESIGSSAFTLERPLYGVTEVVSNLETVVFGVPETYDAEVSTPRNRLRYFAYDAFSKQPNLKEAVIYKNVREITAARQDLIDDKKKELDKLNEKLNELLTKYAGLVDADQIDQTYKEITAKDKEIAAVKAEITDIEDIYGIPRMIRNNINPFTGVHADFTLYVPEQSINMYKLDTKFNWAIYKKVEPLSKWAPKA